MLVSLLLASSLVAVPVSAGSSGSFAGSCPTMDVMMGAHISEPTQPRNQQSGKPPVDRMLPTPKSETKSPAVLLPECRIEPVKRRKRKSDYPMA